MANLVSERYLVKRHIDITFYFCYTIIFLGYHCVQKDCLSNTGNPNDTNRIKGILTMMIFNKRNFRPTFLFSLFLIVTVAQAAWAETRYVSDQLVISLREGRSPSDTAVAFLVAGTPVEILKETNNHLFVRIANGQEGWVRSKFILKQRPKSMVIKELKAEIKELENQIETMGTQAGTTAEDSSDIRQIYELKFKSMEAVLEKEKQSSATARAELKEMKTRNKKLQADVNKLAEQNKSLANEDDGSEALKKEINKLRQTNQELNQELAQMDTAGQPSTLSSAIKWFLAGGGVLLIGLFLGRSVPRKNPYGY